MFRGLCHNCCCNTLSDVRLGVYTRGTFRRTNSCIVIHLRSLVLTVIDVVYVAVVGIVHEPDFLGFSACEVVENSASPPASSLYPLRLTSPSLSISPLPVSSILPSPNTFQSQPP
ncbi:hypothetical protein MRX96_000020 [Rhipicephalus microplus]